MRRNGQECPFYVWVDHAPIHSVRAPSHRRLRRNGSKHPFRIGLIYNLVMVADVAVLLPAAGSGRRFGAARNKLHAEMDGVPIWRRTIQCFTQCERIAKIVMAVSDDDRDDLQRQIDSLGLPVVLVRGGATRLASVRSLLQSIDGDSIGLIAIHDAARPLLQPGDLDAVLSAADRSGAALLAMPVTSSLHRRTGSTLAPVDREELFAAATPQVFRPEVLHRAYQRHRGKHATDDAELVARTGHRVTIVPGRSDNIKITYPSDLGVAAAIADHIKNASASDFGAG